MSDATRRSFLIIAGAGAAAAGAAAVAPVADAAPQKMTGSGPLIAYVNDIASDEVSVMVGEQEVVVRDRDLVARLAARTGKRKD